MSEQMIVATGVPEVHIGQTQPAAQSATPTFSGAWGDMQKDMAAIEKELTPQPAQPAQEQPPAAATATTSTMPATQTPEKPAQQTPPVDAKTIPVPEKFKDSDPEVEKQRILKSFLAAEKELKRLQNAKPESPAQQQAQAQPQQVPANPANLSPFELQVAQDLFNGGGYTEQQAISQARVLVRFQEAQLQAQRATTIGRVEQFEQALQEQERSKELESLAKNAPWIISDKGKAELEAVRKDNPHINASPTPWRDAAIFLLGQRQLYGQSEQGQVQMPIPQGVQQSAPPLPVTPAPVAQAPIRLDTPEQLNAHLKTLTPAQEAEFWERRGLKFKDPPNRSFY